MVIRYFLLILVAKFGLFCQSSIGQDMTGQLEDSFNVSSSVPCLKDSTAVPGAYQYEAYSYLLKGKRIGMVVNQSSLTPMGHLVDVLLEKDHHLVKVFAPEHGFRGRADAGAFVDNSIDAKTGLPLISLYGKKKKPSVEDLQGVDIVVFDIQDVGVRFYTYLSTLHYVMEACAENGILLLVLDRPNPNGFYMDGPVLDPKFSSFVGLHPVPIVYGMTIGEYGMMINGEGWLKGGLKAQLEVISCGNYDRTSCYDLSVKPSPNLPNIQSILLYPSLCLFEPTIVSIGRGTDHPFQCYGHPDFGVGSFVFTPQPKEGAMNPKLNREVCYGAYLGEGAAEAILHKREINFSYLWSVSKFFRERNDYISSPGFFDKLAGTDRLRMALQSGRSMESFEEEYKPQLYKFQNVRSKYLIYPDF